MEVNLNTTINIKFKARKCLVDGCENTSLARGWCCAHYYRWNRYGDVLADKPILPIYKTPELAFAARTEWQPNGCLLWLGALDIGGYGKININGEMAKVSRYAWERENGPIPDGLLSLHRCDNPPCCNVDHLFLGTQADNIKDMIAKGRKNQVKGEDHGRTKITESDVLEIRADSRLYRIIAKDYGVSQRNISSIKSHKSWRHV